MLGNFDKALPLLTEAVAGLQNPQVWEQPHTREIQSEADRNVRACVQHMLGTLCADARSFRRWSSREISRSRILQWVIPTSHFRTVRKTWPSAVESSATSECASARFASSSAALTTVLLVRHPQTLSMLGKLGEFYGDLGDFATARELIEEAVMGLKAVAGENHPDTKRTMNYLVFFERQRRLSEAAGGLAKMAQQAKAAGQTM